MVSFQKQTGVDSKGGAVFSTIRYKKSSSRRRRRKPTARKTRKDLEILGKKK